MDGSILAVNLAVIAALMTGLWLVSLAVHDASIVDPVWGMAFVVIAWSTFLQTGGFGGGPPAGDARRGFIVALVTVWGVRLSLHLARRNLGKGEDFRYVRMRERFGPRFWLASLFVVFLLQAGLAWVVSLPVQAGQITGGYAPLGPLDGLGFVVWLVGLVFETVGDAQLAAFRADPSNRGRVMDRGLWRYTRHPNYFGDFCVWWGLWLVAVAAGAPWTVVGPLLMSVLLIRVSGKGLLETTIGERRPGYADYVARTSGFIPLPPRRR